MIRFRRRERYCNYFQCWCDTVVSRNCPLNGKCFECIYLSIAIFPFWVKRPVFFNHSYLCRQFDSQYDDFEI
ncbi:hypothetical protein D3C81_537200 [compost metagenome]